MAQIRLFSIFIHFRRYCDDLMAIAFQSACRQRNADVAEPAKLWYLNWISLSRRTMKDVRSIYRRQYKYVCSMCKHDWIVMFLTLIVIFCCLRGEWIFMVFVILALIRIHKSVTFMTLCLWYVKGSFLNVVVMDS